MTTYDEADNEIVCRDYGGGSYIVRCRSLTESGSAWDAEVDVFGNPDFKGEALPTRQVTHDTFFRTRAEALKAAEDLAKKLIHS
jgi:hypothetical protein